MAVLSSIPGLDAALAAIKQGSRDGAVNEDGSIRATFVDLPHDREYRVEIVEGKFVHSQGGNEGIRYTLEVTEGEFKGNKVWDNVYFTGHPFQGQRLAVLLASANASAETVEEAASNIVGGKLVIALKEGSDPRYPQTRWVNIDQGQKLRDNLKPATKSSGSSALSADSVDNLIQQRTPTAESPVQAPESPVQAPSAPVGLPTAQSASQAPKTGGIRLPGT
jgi:hypothetical protein